MFKDSLNELKNAFMMKYRDVEDVKQALEELRVCLNVDSKRFALELDEFIKEIN